VAINGSGHKPRPLRKLLTTDHDTVGSNPIALPSVPPGPDHCGHAACVRARGAVRMEDLGVRARAEPGDVDVVGSEAGSHELIAVRPREVEVKSGGRPNAEPALYCVSGMAGLSERLDHFFANLAAADAKAGSNRRDEIAWIRPELACHGADTGASSALNRSPPSRVHGAHRPSPGIGDEHWRAVSNSDGDDEVGVVGEDDVRFGRIPFGVPASRDGYAVAVDLTHESNHGRIRTQRGGNRLPLRRVAA